MIAAPSKDNLIYMTHLAPLKCWLSEAATFTYLDNFGQILPGNKF